MLRLIRQTVGILLVLTVITGVIYPLLVTLVAQTVFPHQANGSLIVKDGKAVGSELIGQPFSDDKYFWPRPSATTPVPYNAANSSGSNLGPLNPALAENVTRQVRALRGVGARPVSLVSESAPDTHPAPRAASLPGLPPGPAVPVDLVTASASGLDPDISPAAAEYQVPRVARARNLSQEKVRELVSRHTRPRQFGVLGEPLVHVLTLNLALDELPE